MDSSHCNNTGSANFISDYNILSGSTPASYLDSAYRTTIFGYPCLLYYKETSTDTQKFLGVYNLNLDKSCTGSFGFEETLKDSDSVKYDFKHVRYIEDDLSSDILVKATTDGASLSSTEETMQIVLKGVDGEYHKESATIYQNESGEKLAASADGSTFYRINYIGATPYLVLKNPSDGVECALLSEKNQILSINGDQISNTECVEIKANSGAAGAGGFGNYKIGSVATDLELRYPDDGDIEDEQYATYVDSVGKMNAIDYAHFKAGWYYNYQRMIRWVSKANEEDFLANTTKYFNKTYLMDYYLTIMLLGGVDSLGKNLMVATWGPENYLYVTDSSVLDSSNENYDKYAFEYEIGGKTVYLTPTKNKVSGKYVFAENEEGLLLYYKEGVFNRFTNSFESGYSQFDASVVTTIPGSSIFYPIFYDIDTINGLDNSGHLLFDIDIEIGDRLSDGTSVFNTDDSNLWARVRNYFGKSGDLAARWSSLRNKYFTTENLVGKFYYERQISKIPERYYNDDCMIKYIQEGPFAPGEIVPGTSDPVKVGSGAYLYCIHGSRYEHIKRWFTQRIYYLDTMFGLIGANNASLRFNHASYDANFGHTADYYASYPALAAKYPEFYQYDQESGALLDSTSGREIIPINFNVKTYQPAYVGVRWANAAGANIIYYRVSRDSSVTITGNVPAAGDSEVFIFGDKNIKELGDLSPYNVKQVDFKNLTRLSKLILGSEDYSTVIHTLSLGSNTYLSELQLTNCTSLTSVNVEGCNNLRTINMTGSGITTITLPKGGSLESISYSDVITSINLEDFVNLSNVVTPSLTNLNTLVIKNCPKILGSKTSPNAKGWALLQQTRLATNLNSIEMTSYGKVDPILTSSGEWFFADKYYNYETSSKIRGEVYYSGTSIPVNYARFDKAYPKLKISYTNISDASEMFANYKNLLCIQKISAYIGDNLYGDPQYKDMYYWVDDTEELINKWQNEEAYSKYGADTVYTDDSTYYIVGEQYYRPLQICDKADKDRLRNEIKSALKNFNGIKFTNVKGMFRNLTILDYLDEDTFNGIDLSSADTSEMFYGCTGLKYFTVPDDNTKNEPVMLYYNSEGEEVSFEDWDPATGTSSQKRNSSGELLYSEIFTGNEVTNTMSVYPKGIRNLGDRMFYECRKARVLIRKLSNNDKVSINESTFEYVTYNPSLESQSNTITCERPVVMFCHNDTDILKLVETPTKEILEKEVELEPAGENLYFDLNENYERVVDFDNPYITFNSISLNYLREVYFGINSIVIDDENYEGANDFTISYAVRNNGTIILLDAERKSGSSVKDFNKQIESGKYNVMKISSLTQGSLLKLADIIETYEIPLPTYDCLDTNIPRQDYEKSVLSLFTNISYYQMDEDIISKNAPSTINALYIVDTETVPSFAFAYFKDLKYVGFDTSVKVIKNNAFYRCSNLTKMAFMRNISEDVNLANKNLHLTAIYESAFEGCNLSQTLTLPDTLSILGDNAFKDCPNIESVNYSSKLLYFPKAVFYNGTKLRNISNVSSELEKIGDAAFYNCINFDVFPLIKENEDYGSCSLAASGNLEYFKNLSYIGDNAFYKCNMISSGKPLEDGSLSLRTIVIPKSIKYIGNNAFYQDLGTESPINVEIIWIDNNGNNEYSELVIGTGAFANIRTSWKPEGYEKPIEDIIYLPRVASVGTGIFRSRGNSKFLFAVTDFSSGEIVYNWVSVVNKVIYNYSGIIEINNGDYNSTYLLSDNGTNKYAYLYKIDTAISNFEVPKEVEYQGAQYGVKELLSGCLDLSSETLNSIIFSTDSVLDTIESEVLKSPNLITILTIDGSEEKENTIPENLKIMSGNVLKETSWFELSASETGYVVLGHYIIGYKLAEGETLTEVDLSDPKVVNCSTVYDRAFEGMKTISTLNISDNIECIYEKAFAECEAIRSITLPKTIKEIGAEAFMNCSIKEIFIPNSVEKVGSTPFGNNNRLGCLESVIIEDGANLTALPFHITPEIKPAGMNSGVNISLMRLHIPASMQSVISDSTLRSLSQIVKLTVGGLRKNEKDGSYLIDSYPIYLKESGEKFIYTDADGNHISDTLTQASDESGNLLYCPAFYYDTVKEKFPSLFIESKESSSPYPLPLYEKNLDIGFIKTYSEKEPMNGIDISSIESRLRDLTKEDILRILSGISKIGSTKTVYIRHSDYTKLTKTERDLFSTKISFTIYK